MRVQVFVLDLLNLNIVMLGVLMLLHQLLSCAHFRRSRAAVYGR